MDADQDRLALEILGRGVDVAADELARALGRSPSAVRRRLARLGREGRVAFRRAGRTRRWHVVAPRQGDPARIACAETTCGAWTAARELQVTPEGLAQLVRDAVLTPVATRDGLRYDRAEVARVRGGLMRKKTAKIRRGSTS